MGGAGAFRRNQYMQFLEELIDAGLVGNSSEALEDGIKRTKKGEILAWPIKRDTLTFSPAEPRMMTDNGWLRSNLYLP
jgi:hypothetical protein